VSILSPDVTPPLQPYCGLCDLICERLIFDRQLNPWYWSFQVQCCGQTRGARLSIEEILRINATNEKYFAIPKRAHTQTIKALPKFGPPPKQKIVVPILRRKGSR